ncbi:MAG: L,D-transpeptidase family protein [Bacteroidales bacterium]|nr:L,D-transpeptidase family protein [Bacteroidales bacterium]
MEFNKYITIPKDCIQLIHVYQSNPNNIIRLKCYQYQSEKWYDIGINSEVNIGEKGFASLGCKREGDKKTPMGLFPLGIAFGYIDHCITGLNYRTIENTHYWIDDPANEAYNTWVDYKPNCSSEKMKREDVLYKYGIVIEYNTQPVEKNMGSAIFIHIERAKNSSTDGCVSMPETKLIEILSWLDKKKYPHILLGGLPSVPRDL